MPTTHAALSPSRASDFRSCPLKFRFRVIDKLSEPPSVEALRGTIVHAVLEHLFDRPASDRNELNAQDSLIPTWEEHLKKSPTDSELFTDSTQLSTWLESARPLISAYFNLENPQYLQPSGREQFVNAILPSGLAIRGIIDRIDTAPNGAVRVVDYKTGKSPAPRYQAGAIFQMRFYATALFYSAGKLPQRTQLLYLKDQRVLTYDPVQADVSTTTSELNHLWSAIRARIDTGNFEAKKGPLCNWCHFSSLCPAFGNVAPEIDENGITALLTAERPSTDANLQPKDLPTNQQ
ncbi:RecB family exonuclease [Arcanobacterium pinnipediorum]|uniref:PD-(D/E)XK nuclease family protein n=1 Tax=Arcanobacterium pinnipediorum TaxID=1503041 RepID=A0ABY5AFM1_9ACTO|nr:PD-(D/E)XK nuclease family protein [Arcanobacterium pinnipediorum]USR78672.1 PD-(D/E)XK nuclease family protein [Arcanobacterium pinnipediorum]